MEEKETYVYRLYDPITNTFKKSRSNKSTWSTLGALNSARRWMYHNDNLIIKKYKLVLVEVTETNGSTNE